MLAVRRPLERHAVVRVRRGTTADLVDGRRDPGQD